MEEIMNEEMLLTQEGYDKIVAEHEELVSVKRAEVAARIKEAISYGDISENAEYDSAKNEQAELEEKIHELEEILRKAKIVQDEDVRGDTVNIGLKVTVQDLDTGDIEVYSIVGATESDPFNGKISTDSSVGKGLIGKKKNDTVAIEVPDGVINYKIMNIEK
ncbi:MAG: transcription elongation factor GreA [Clostridiales bacterium]|nr:transcription elongation factor GreA [Clostridiales bacterium]MCI7392737.1 transcription elongation factor GreA [Clostridiales bacterium]MDY5607205.1 transcription elongation factor GreA [Lentihominibacter sp.]MDY6174826.1 transcription elongation factor GreA [Lentihominibacter sp.]